MMKPGAQFMDAVAKQVCLGPTQFMSEFREPLDFHAAFVLRFRWKRVKPVEHGNRAVGLAVK